MSTDDSSSDLEVLDVIVSRVRKAKEKSEKRKKKTSPDSSLKKKHKKTEQDIGTPPEKIVIKKNVTPTKTKYEIVPVREREKKPPVKCEIVHATDNVCNDLEMICESGSEDEQYTFHWNFKQYITDTKQEVKEEIAETSSKQEESDSKEVSSKKEVSGSEEVSSKKEVSGSEEVSSKKEVSSSEEVKEEVNETTVKEGESIGIKETEEDNNEIIPDIDNAIQKENEIKMEDNKISKETVSTESVSEPDKTVESLTTPVLETDKQLEDKSCEPSTDSSNVLPGSCEIPESQSTSVTSETVPEEIKP